MLARIDSKDCAMSVQRGNCATIQGKDSRLNFIFWVHVPESSKNATDQALAKSTQETCQVGWSIHQQNNEDIWYRRINLVFFLINSKTKKKEIISYA